MKIIKPYYQILSKIEGTEILKHIKYMKGILFFIYLHIKMRVRLRCRSSTRL
jgi:hypothetical protein